MALKSSLDDPISIRGEDNRKNCCRPTLRTKWLKHKGALLVLIWSFLCSPVYHYFTLRKISRSPIKEKLPLQSDATISMGLLLPIGGWLADAFFGRYKVIRCGIWIMWFGAMLNGVSLVIGKVVEAYGNHGDPWVSLSSKFIMGIGLGAFQANIVQFGIDQLIDASSTEIKSVIAWYTMTIFTSGIVMYYSSYCIQEYVAVLIIAMFLTLAVCADFIVGHWLTKVQIIENPLPLILKAIHYTIKHKLKRQKMLYSQENQGILSKFNVAKRIYNGPFTSEQVEDVKTFFRVLVVIVVFTIFSSGSGTVDDISYQIAIHLGNWPSDDTINGCYHGMGIYYATYTSPAIVALIYLIVIHPLFHRFIPRMSIAVKFLFSIFIFSAAVLVLLGIETSSYLLDKRLNRTAISGYAFHKDSYSYIIDAHWVILPNFLIGLSMFLYVLSGIEFICAQAPFNMKGLVLGIACALFGLGSLINASISEAFVKNDSLWKNAPLMSGILWYLIMEGVIVLIGFIVLVVIVKMYKRRTRISMSYEQTNWQEGDIQ